MIVSPFESPAFAGLWADPETTAAFTDAAAIAAMVHVEAALARAEAAHGVIPSAAGMELAAALEAMEPIPPEALSAGVAASATPVPALLAALRERLDPDLGRWLHWGATSQDILDTALVLRLATALTRMEALLDRTLARLATLAEAHRATPMAGRTWGQQAAPTAFGLLCAAWAGPPLRLKARLAEMRPRVLAVQLGGSVGSRSVIGAPASAQAVARTMARDLGLAPAAPWHAQRDRMTEAGAWAADLAGALGKIGADVVLLAQSEVAEVRLAAAGGSSTMPQKRNPVGPSTLVALARHAAGLQATLQGAAVHGLERDGQAWLAEWLALPPLFCAAGGAARLATETLEGLEPDPARMRANLEAAGGALLAEAATFALADPAGSTAGPALPRPEAAALVKRAAAEGGAFTAALARESGDVRDWEGFAEPARHLGAASALIDDTLAAIRAALEAP